VPLSWSAAVRFLAVLQVQGQAFAVRSDGSRDTASEPGYEDAGRLLHGVEGVLRQLGRVEADRREIAGRQLAAVEDVQHLVALVGVRRPVNDQEPADRRRDPQLFADLVVARGER